MGSAREWERPECLIPAGEATAGLVLSPGFARLVGRGGRTSSVEAPPAQPGARAGGSTRPLLVGLTLISLLAVVVGVLRSGSDGGKSPGLRSPAIPSGKTVVLHVRPVDDQGHLLPGFSVTDTVHGADCWDGSEEVAGAGRCGAGNYIYDPCWAEADGPSGPSVVCLLWPWDHAVDRLLIGSELSTDPREPTGPDASPWAVELADGQRCRIYTGAHSSLNPASEDDTDVLDYYCDEAEDLVLLRGLDESHLVWTARAARRDAVNDHYARVQPQSIARAWF